MLASPYHDTTPFFWKDFPLGFPQKFPSNLQDAGAAAHDYFAVDLPLTPERIRMAWRPWEGWQGWVLKMILFFEGSGILKVYFFDLFGRFFCPKRHKVFLILAPWSGGKSLYFKS